MTQLHDSGRSRIVAALRRELFGPEANPSGDQPDILSRDPHDAESGWRSISLDPPPVFASANDAYGPFREAGTGQEILLRDRPTKRYGVGVLYPPEQLLTDVNEGDPGEEALADIVSPDADLVSPEAANDVGNTVGAPDEMDDFDLSATNQYRPSAMAVSFLAELTTADQINVEVSGARYEEKRVTVDGRSRTWFVRRPCAFTVAFEAPRLAGLHHPVTAVPDLSPLELRVDLLARLRADGNWLLTVALVNFAPSDRSADLCSLFQSAFTVTISRGDVRQPAIIPYPDPAAQRLLKRDAEARSLDLLYRNAPTFAVGHGCAATWDEPWGVHLCEAVHATALPQFETPSVTPDVTLPSGERIEVPIGPLAGLDEADDGFASLQFVAHAYGEWIDRLESESQALAGFRKEAADDHLQKCRRAHERFVDGIEWLRSDTTARRAFVLANRAILEQQLHFRPESRATVLQRDGSQKVESAKRNKTWQEADIRWRAFQIGFLVSTAQSAVNGDHPDRETVELIFFPTGGGKTEAYLGLAAFCLFYERLTQRTAGVSVIMRYTLRLLTTQQFIRASALICAMEIIRVEEQILGDEFSIGIWVGGSTTPNTRAQAVSEFNALAKGFGANPFLLLRCPWCAAQLGKVDTEQGYPRNLPKIAGYRLTRGSVQFVCPDRFCPFHNGLPVYVVDEDIYAKRPSIVIGTVDKFAMLAFVPDARGLFGLDENGNREFDPPNLIIQDELHLIAGPLGSMVGIYEAIIEELCTSSNGVRPKIIGSTATIRNYSEQIRGLYGRIDAALFPPHGIDAADSFFAQYARDPESGSLLQGRLYVGVHAPGLGSIQTAQVRAGSALLQAALAVPDSERDPWWTSMMFFNSLRELGTSVSLLQSDIPDYLYAMKLRDGNPQQRYIGHLMELTSRLRQDEIPEAISKLERVAGSGGVVDACLASNIIEVGVDIPRLSLLTVLGQPKTTSQYIQVTGRVGRKWQEKPGLVVTIYSSTRPRDRSHYERFQSYHQRLYAEVEPVSVTPFSLPVLERAAHAAVLAYVRQNAHRSSGPELTSDVLSLFQDAEEILSRRAEISDPETMPNVKYWMDRRRGEWEGWEPAVWETRTGTEDGPLMRRAGEWIDDELIDITWAVPMSMRDVDAECRCAITNRYAIERGEDPEGTDA